MFMGCSTKSKFLSVTYGNAFRIFLNLILGYSLWLRVFFNNYKRRHSYLGKIIPKGYGKLWKMKKLFVLSFAMLLVATITGASTLKMSGEYYVRGTWLKNHNGNAATNLNGSYGIYDHALRLDITWAMTPYTKVFTRMKFRDEYWAVSTNPNEEDRNGEQDDNLAVERLWAQHTFMNHTTIKVGLVQTAAWASGFANDPKEAYRLMVIQPTPIGTFIALTEKDQTYDYDLSPYSTKTVVSESAAPDIDNDVYVAALITKVGDVNVLPLVRYVDSETDDLQKMAFDLGVNGTINNIGFEAEFIFADYNYESSALTPDYSIWAAYANVWVQLNALKSGAFIAHGPFNNDTNTEVALEDYTAKTENIALENYDGLIADGKLGYYDNNTLTTLAIYVTYAINEKASVALFGAYADFNIDNSYGKYDGAIAWEVNVGVGYKITPLLIYSAVAIAQKEYGNGSTDPAIKLMHKLSFNF